VFLPVAEMDVQYQPQHLPQHEDAFLAEGIRTGGAPETGSTLQVGDQQPELVEDVPALAADLTIVQRQVATPFVLRDV